MWWYGYGWGGGLLMLLSMLLWVAVFGLLVWALIRWLGPRATGGGMPPSGPTSGPSAMEILRQRYARGEIDAATFEQMRERLEGSVSQPREPLTT
jgi:putative membrane protein